MFVYAHHPDHRRVGCRGSAHPILQVGGGVGSSIPRGCPCDEGGAIAGWTRPYPGTVRKGDLRMTASTEQCPRSYRVRTYGCQMNVHDSERLAGLLESAGYVPAEPDATPDVVVLNTCAVRENADNRLYGNLGQLRPIKRDHPGRSEERRVGKECRARWTRSH